MSEPLTLVIYNSSFHVLWHFCFQLGKGTARDGLLGLGWKQYSLLFAACWFNLFETPKMVWENTVQLVLAKYAMLGIQSVQHFLL